MVRAVLVDADGVLQVNADDWLDRLRAFVPATDGDEFVDDLFAAEKPAMRGERRFADVVADVCARWGLTGREDELVDHWRHAIVQPEVVEVVRELRAAGIACHLATNQNDVRAAYLLDDLGYADLFDSTFCSCELGTTKDDPAFLRLAAERPDQLFEPVQRGARQRQHLLAALDEVDAADAHGVDQHDLAIIVVAERRGAAVEAGIRRLHDDDAASLDRRLEHPPLLEQRARPDHRQHPALAIAIALAEAAVLARIGDDMGIADDAAKLRQQRFAGNLIGQGHGDAAEFEVEFQISA